jgi:hypothetical protein
MVARHAITVFMMAFLAMITSPATLGSDVYHWLDENGVPNFSQKEPGGEIQSVSRLNLPDTTPPDYDPNEDRYGIEEQAERMTALREEMDEQREDARERRRNTVQQQPLQYPEPYRSYSRGIWYPPVYPRPPQRPHPPIEVPYRTATLGRPGG